MKSLLNLALAVFLIAFLGSCRIYFNQDIRDRVQRESIEKIEGVQFYNNEEIRLVFKSTSAEEEIKGGKVKLEDGVYNYYVTIPRQTPAIARHLDETRLMVFFEAGVNRYLIFEKINDPIVLKQTKKGPLLMEESVGRYMISSVEKDGELFVSFEDKDMRILSGKNSFLLMKKLKLNVEEASDKRRVKGLKVD